MTRVSLLTLLLALGISAAAYAQEVSAPASTNNTAPSTSTGHKTPPANNNNNHNAPHPNNNGSALHANYQTLATDDEEIRALDRKRDEALRANNPAAAQQIQAQIDTLRAARKNVQKNIGQEKFAIQQQKMTDEEKCARDPVCAAKKKREMLDRQLQFSAQQLTADKAAAARVSQDEATISNLENAIKALGAAGR